MGLRSAQGMVAALAATSLAGCTGYEVTPVTKEAMFENDVGLGPSTFAEFMVPMARGTARKGKVIGFDEKENRVFYVMPSFSDEEVEKFDFRVDLSLLNNNKPDAGLRQMLKIAKSRCDLAALPTSEEVDLMQGPTIYFLREYFFRCPAAEKETQ